ncbi:MAG: hypothetical protein ACO3NZ_06015 [Pirellulales bacterium]
MRDQKVIGNVGLSRAGLTLVAVMALVLSGSVSMAQGPTSPGTGFGSSWQTPPPRQSAAYGTASVSQQRAARPTRIAMLDGETVMDGDVMMMDDGSGYVGSLGMTSEPCNSCRTPPWHGNVMDPCACGPVCDPCDQSYRRSCFPRFNALFSKGYLPSPMPPCVPRCNHCGATVEVGF